MTKVISIFTQKGGVGKTTTTINVMAELTRKGYKVLGIDIDAQGNLTKFLGVPTENENTLLELLTGEATFEETLVKTKYGDCIGSDRNLQLFLKKFSSDFNAVFAMQEFVESVAPKYDYILIDCPPSANELAISSLVASNFVLVPSELEYFSVDGFVEIAKTVESVRKKLNKNLKVLGAVFVKYKARRKLTQQMEDKCNSLINDYLKTSVFNSKISDGTAVPCSQVNRQSLFDYDPIASVTLEYAELTQEIIEHCEEAQ